MQKLKIKRQNNICCLEITILFKSSNNNILLLHRSFIASGSSKNLSDALLTFLTHVLDGVLGNLLNKKIYVFSSVHFQGIPKIRLTKRPKIMEAAKGLENGWFPTFTVHSGGFCGLFGVITLSKPNFLGILVILYRKWILRRVSEKYLK